jgi:hypothetical protein
MCWKLSATSGERPCCGRRRDCRRGYDAESANCPAFCRLRDCDEAHDRPACAPARTCDHQQEKEAHNGCSAPDDPALATIDALGPGRRHPRGSGARGRIRGPHRNGHFGCPPPSCDHCSWCGVQLRRGDHLGYVRALPADRPLQGLLNKSRGGQEAEASRASAFFVRGRPHHAADHHPQQADSELGPAMMISDSPTGRSTKNHAPPPGGGHTGLR